MTTGLAVIAALTLAACSGSPEEPGQAAGEVRALRIDALDTLAFDPEAVSVSEGETIRFVVTNTGAVVHEFVLGPEPVQTAHQEAGGTGEGHGGMHVEGQLAALELDPGETEEVTVTLSESGDVLFGCHEPGHYEGGMVGTVTVR